MKTTVVVSQCGGTGKTTLAIAVAVMLARAGKIVCLVDLDFGGSQMLEIVQSKPEPCQVSNEMISFSSARKQLPKIRLKSLLPYHEVYVLPASADPAERFYSTSEEELVGTLEYTWQIKDLLKRMSELGFDHVLLDTPPGNQWLSRAAVLTTGENDCVLWCTRNGVGETASWFYANGREMRGRGLRFIVVNPNHTGDGSNHPMSPRTIKLKQPGSHGNVEEDFGFLESGRPDISSLPDADNPIEQDCLESIVRLIDGTEHLRFNPPFGG